MLERIDDLTAAMAAGNRQAVEIFYRRYFTTLYRLAAQATLRDEAFCLDIVQEAMLRIVRNIRCTPSEAQLIAWLRLVVRSTAYDMLRAEQRRRQRERAVAMTEATVPSSDDNRLEALRWQLEHADPRIVKLIHLRYTQQWTLLRIAAALGLSVGTVDGRLRRAIKQMRTEIEEMCDEPQTRCP